MRLNPGVTLAGHRPWRTGEVLVKGGSGSRACRRRGGRRNSLSMPKVFIINPNWMWGSSRRRTDALHGRISADIRRRLINPAGRHSRRPHLFRIDPCSRGALANRHQRFRRQSRHAARPADVLRRQSWPAFRTLPTRKSRSKLLAPQIKVRIDTQLPLPWRADAADSGHDAARALVRGEGCAGGPKADAGTLNRAPAGTFALAARAGADILVPAWQRYPYPIATIEDGDGPTSQPRRRQAHIVRRPTPDRALSEIVGFIRKGRRQTDAGRLFHHLGGQFQAQERASRLVGLFPSSRWCADVRGALQPLTNRSSCRR